MKDHGGPLGILYIDDYAEFENSALYNGCVQTFGVIGSAFGLLLESLCTKVYVDIGYVDMVTIMPDDVHWVGAWWLGYLIAGIITLMSGVLFWFLPKSLPIPVDKHDGSCTPDQTRFITMNHKLQPEEPANLHLMAKEFVPTLKSLLGNPVYIIYLCVVTIQLNSLIGMATYKSKYTELHYGYSASKANFLMGMINIPAVALGMLSGGVVMKKYKLGVLGAVKFAFGTSLLGYFLSLLFLVMGCENSKVAGITVSYAGLCKGYLTKKDSDGVLHQITWPPRSLDLNSIEMVWGELDRKVKTKEPTSAKHLWELLQDWCTKPELKSLALGIHTLALRVLAEVPAPIYFGAITDSSCLTWGYNTCGEKGHCRIYNNTAYRTDVCLGLTFGLRAISFLLCIWGFALLKRHILREETKADGKSELEFLSKEENSSADYEQLIQSSDSSPDRETHL
ncbi:solute carrier organic anion transporter family member 1C1-like [Austrofundulus limnaeus]|uniref:Solute carrier organic anion transporter family member 1C1-like n=1 Tax=Austrofundulus limnaeus TaxID=52670 RepID=A0A2I4BXW0_AUSLI|nr:PREDICTED: solute carrier organic anion transporter family member 1C1-like [Austrofundulus limnaeus]